MTGGIAGFMADENDCVSFHLGWTVDESEADRNMKMLNDADGWVDLEISKVPEELQAVEHYDVLELRFKDKVDIPDWFYDMDIDQLIIRGKVSSAQKKKLEERFGEDNVTIRR